MFAWLGTLWDRWKGWRWRSKPGRLSAYRDVRVLESAVNPGPALARGHVVVVGSAEHPKWLRFECPCRCGEVIALNLMPTHRPHWTVELHPDGSVTAHPSVDAKSCGSHFWLRRSKVAWA